MICKICAEAADAKLPREYHCDDAACSCGHRPQQPK